MNATHKKKDQSTNKSLPTKMNLASFSPNDFQRRFEGQQETTTEIS